MRPSAQATPSSGTDAFWSLPQDGLLAATASVAEGLSAAEATRRLARDGPNAIEVAHPHRGLRLLVAQFTSPIVVILVAATVLSMALGDLSDGLIILLIVAASGALGFWQERTAGHAVDALMAQVRVEVEVRRGGGQVSVPVEEVVVGDLVVLRAGATLFRSGWFIESTVTELAVMLVLRTNRPFYRSRPGRGLLWSSIAIAAITLALPPYSPLAGPLGLTAGPAEVLAILVGLTALYVIANEAAKRRYPPADTAVTRGERA